MGFPRWLVWREGPHPSRQTSQGRGERNRRAPVQTTTRTAVVILIAPLVQHIPCLRQAQEQLPVPHPAACHPKLSTYPFSQGLPFLMQSVSTAARPSHCRISFAMNSGPLSPPMCSGAPRTANGYCSYITHRTRRTPQSAEVLPSSQFRYAALPAMIGRAIISGVS